MTIDLRESSLRVGSTDIVSAPSTDEFLSLLGIRKEDGRTFADIGSGNSVTVLDEIGIHFLSSSVTGKIAGFGLAMEEPKWRRRTERDPRKLFSGEIAIGGRRLPRPVTTSMADLIAQKRFSSVGVRMTPHDHTIASVFFSFPEEEKKTPNQAAQTTPGLRPVVSDLKR